MKNSESSDKGTLVFNQYIYPEFDVIVTPYCYNDTSDTSRTTRKKSIDQVKENQVKLWYDKIIPSMMEDANNFTLYSILPLLYHH